MTISRTPVVLDFDASVTDLPGEQRIELQSWQEMIRFGCRWSEYRQLAASITPQLPSDLGCVLMGSGDYHHISQLLVERLPADQQIQLIICDNHPDNMRYPFGIHCGSWVYWASRLPQIAHIHVLGIGSGDIGLAHAWENHWSPLLKGKLTYWNTNVDTRWLNWLGAGRSSRTFKDADSLMQAFLQQLSSLPVYLSIDKDVLSSQVVKTNWDQGIFLEQHLNQLIDACAGRIQGADITGDVSDYQYHSRFKRWLSAADGQQAISKADIQQWQIEQNALNHRLVSRLHAGWQDR